MRRRKDSHYKDVPVVLPGGVSGIITLTADHLIPKWKELCPFCKGECRWDSDEAVWCCDDCRQKPECNYGWVENPSGTYYQPAPGFGGGHMPHVQGQVTLKGVEYLNPFEEKWDTLAAALDSAEQWWSEGEPGVSRGLPKQILAADGREIMNQEDIHREVMPRLERKGLA